MKRSWAWWGLDFIGDLVGGMEIPRVRKTVAV